MPHGKIKVKSILSLSLILLLTGCKNSVNVNTAYEIRESRWNDAAITTAASENVTQETSTQTSVENGTTADGDIYRYKGYAEGETIVHTSPNGSTWTQVYKTSYSKRKNEKYGKFGEIITYGGCELTVTDAVYTNTFNTLYDMVDKETADSYISYIKENHSYVIDSDNTYIYGSKNDTVQDMLRGGYRMGALLVKCRIKNVSDKTRDLRVAMAKCFDITDSGDTLESSFGCFFLGQYDAVGGIHTGLIEKDKYISLKPDEEREVILVFDHSYTMDKLVNYGRDYALNRTVYLSSMFLLEEGSYNHVDIAEGSYLIPIVDHGVVCGSGQKLE